jgi:sulfoxide reductase heme-binding subunit YedZ
MATGQRRVIALTSPYLWYTSRATGIVTLVLFTSVVALGALVANRVGGKSVGRFEINELHRSLSLVAMIFLAFHIVTTVLDTYAPTGWLSAVLPFASHYERVGVAVGAIAFDLMIAVWISSLLKARVRHQSWRFIHWFSWLAFASAILHAYLNGADTKSGAGLALVIACALVVLGAGTWRFIKRPPRAIGRTALSALAGASSNAPASRDRVRGVR